MGQRREIRQIIPAHATSDGDGVKISRVAGFNNAGLSPFLMIDELKSDQLSDYVGGFPPHPHRGIETLTYMLKGHFQHKDHMGNVGELRSGGAQWMAAGRGVIHSEMPIMQDGDLHGFQIWINQPARDKMKPAQYHDFQPETITEYQDESVGVLRVLAGEVSVEGNVKKGPLNKTGVPLSVSDWRSETDQKIKLLTPQKFNMMLYVYQGEISLNGQHVQHGEMALLSTGEAVSLVATKSSGVLILLGEPIDEPIVHYGPFVMNSMQEIEQAISDYNSGEFEKY
ncbi:pirin family protein [Vibrio neptunius]|uniref:pirin family protein n=1 Tax=Vibrio neptunius TaxID=170651 RepID=UPI0019D11ADB|nr:pirin family protein [Vibrio neptunius]MBN3573938.1 pirin family protein [Vibrio neptunius]QXX09175.1 pirin family protein [Vibrio neptunius]